MTERHYWVDLGNSSLKVLTLRVVTSGGSELESGDLSSDDWQAIGRREPDAVSRLASAAPVTFASPAELIASLPVPPEDLVEPERWTIASVNPPALHQLLDMLSARPSAHSPLVLQADDFPIPLEIDFPERLGLDRLAAATAAAALREAGHGAIVIDAGTATTVDAVDASGQFRGGAILASPALMLKALGAHTRLLPTLSDEFAAAPPAAIGRNTEAALRSGAFWGQVGAIQALIDQQSLVLRSWSPSAARSRDQLEPIDVMLCGGVADLLGEHLRPRPRRWPGLVLAGIAIAAASRS